ncbi:MAG: PAS domain-containing protein [Solobacterium sp.]|jgi:PAS domain S-box-containing protein|nr:PAS domain-containing protein [Solobacterium sp.]MCH4205417.1 PAS domain-containing protein [Solobacterium sp.]MCH4226629.1 PAS domain-containing protein [Solobacterium sp.]MCH4282104.1 PAS domain-containing protein [Solobacterium sp.]
MKTALALVKEFCTNDFVRRDTEKSLSFLANDIHWFGTSDNEDVFNIEDARRYIEDEVEQIPSPYHLDFLEENAIPIDQNTEAAYLRIRLENSGVSIVVRITAVTKIEDGGPKICSMHFSVADEEQVKGEYFPLLKKEEKIFNEKRELVLSTIAGGMMGGYMKPDFPLYFIDERMLAYLGYQSEEEFSADIDGLISNIIHPDDRKMVDDEVDRQLAVSDHYTVDYRMRKKDQSYIWVHDIGKVTKSIDDEDVIISVCYDITEDHNKQIQLDNLINAMPGGVVIYRIKGNEFSILYQSKGVSALSGRTEAEFSSVIEQDKAASVYSEDVDRVEAAMNKAVVSNESVSLDYRIPVMTGGYRWINASFRKVGEENGYAFVHAVYSEMSQLQELFREITDNAELAVGVSDNETHEILYANQYARSIYHKEGVDYTGKKCYSFLRGFKEPCRFCDQLYTNGKGAEQRDIYDPASDRYFLSQGRLINWGGREAHVVYLTDNTNNHRSQQKMQEMLKNVTSGILVCHIDWEGKIHNTAVNEGLCRLFERSEEELLDQLYPISSYIYADEDVMKVDELIEEATKHKHAHSTFRISVPDGRIKSLAVDVNIVKDTEKTKTAYITFSDITAQKEQAQQLKDVLKNVPGGVCLYHWDGKKLNPLVISEHFSSLLGADAKERIGNTDDLDFVNVHPDDLEGLKKAIYHTIEMHEVNEFAYRTWNADKKQYIWLSCQAIALPQADGTAMVYASYADITNERETALQLIASETALDIAAKEAGLWYWKYEPDNDRAFFGERTMTSLGLPHVLENFSETWLTYGMILPAYHSVYLNALDKIKRGEPQAVFEAQIMVNHEIHWAEFHFTNLPKAEGQDRIAVCTGRSIDYEKSLAAKYELEKQKPVLGEKNLLFHCIFDLESDHTEEYGSAFTDLSLKKKYPTREKIVDHAAEQIISEKDRKKFIKINSAEYLKEQLKTGNNSFSMNYRRRLPDGRISWTKNILHLVENPDTRKPIAFEYCYDIDEQKMLEEVLSNSAGKDYEFICSVNFQTDRMIPYHSQDPNDRREASSYQASIDEYAKRMVLPEEREQFYLNASPETIMKEASHGNPYTYSIKVSLPDGSMGVKRVRALPYDAENKIYIMTRTDVTDVLRTEDIQNGNLKEALSIAQQANNAKSNFLSSMSHDMRTPMNAIIGMCNLAMEDEKDTAQIHESLTAIQSSSQLLLSLINNILDMNRIEAGVMELNNQKFSMKEELERSKNTYDALIEQKHQSLELSADIKHDHCMGDVSRIHSALDNILSNAIKYTPDGGRIVFRISEEPTENDQIGRFIFKISDNGYGMDEETQKHMYEPLYRGKSPSTSKVEGTGLGLSIAKAIVDLKGGTIACCSEKGKGTEFTIELPLAYADNEEGAVKPSEEQRSLSSYDLSNIHILVCEDHPLNQKVIQKVLEKANAEVTLADDGKIGSDLFLNSPADAFDLILMDIRMPNMDGYEATRVIRSSQHPRAKTIPIVAMTANAYAEDVKKSLAAGMNKHLAKPIEPKTVYETILQYVHK